MKAVAATKYGSPEVLRLTEIDKPVPKSNEVLVKIFATTVTAGDCETRKFKFPILFWLPLRLVIGIRKPRTGILGQELAGEIESSGKDVTQFRKGDQVFTGALGAYAEYICLSGKHPMGIKPANIGYEEAATIPVGGVNALHFLKKARIETGQKLLINGAGGSIGTYAVQIAKSLGAEVTAVDTTKKLEMLCSIGADHVIDYTKEDFTRNGETYEVIFDVVGKSSFSPSIRSLKANGRYVLANPGLILVLRGLWTLATSNKRVITGLAPYRAKDFAFLKGLIESGKIKPVIDRRYPLEQIAEAHRYVENGHKTGNVVVTVGARTLAQSPAASQD